MPCRIETESEKGRTVIRLIGVFDHASAFELRDLLERETGYLVLDFSLVHEFVDLGVATLAHGLAGAEQRLTVRGLRQHQLRIFRYLGLDVDALQSSERLGGAAPSDV